MRLLLGGLFVGALLASGFAQEAVTSKQEEPTVDQLIERLGDPAYAVRERAEADLRSKGKAVLGKVDEAARGHDDPEVRSRAQWLSDDMRRGGSKNRTLDLPVRRFNRNFADTFESLFDRLDRDFPMGSPARSVFQHDIFGGLRDQILDMERSLEEVAALGQSGSSTSTFRSSNLSVGPDGVEVIVEEKNGEGEAQTKTYTAPDLESFRAKYPEIAQQYLSSGASKFRLPFGSEPLLGRGRLSLDPAVPMFGAWQEGPVLGVYTRPIGEDLREFLELAGDRGLFVERVTPGGVADAAGLKARDVIVTINDRPIAHALDVRQALRDADRSVKITVNRKGQSLTLEGVVPRKKV